jgi:hypothetical protein
VKTLRHSQIPTAVALVIGVVLGWVLAVMRPAPLRAGGGDRSGESAVATGPVFVRYDEGAKAAIPLDAVYVLDYKGGRLLATIPIFRQSTSSTQVIDTFVERDLVADFKLDLESGATPRFLMTTGSLGPYTSGWAPLFVFETTTNQVAVYRIQMQESTKKGSRPRFELLELRSYAKTGGAETKPSS